MDERQLMVLRELGELGSARAVADHLHITPSAVSQQLRLLQRSIGTPLTVRRGRTLALTDAGRLLADAAAEVQTAMARARQVVDALSETPSGVVSVAAFNSAASAFFPALQSALPDSGPVKLRLTDEDVAQADFPRLTARYDVVLAHRLSHTEPWPDTIAVTPLLHEPLDVALPEGHELAERNEITAEDAADQRWITTHDGFPIIASIDALAAAAGRPITLTHRINEFSIAAELVQAGGGLALVPRWTVPRPPGVVLRPLAGVTGRRHIDALYRREHTFRQPVRRVLTELLRIAGQIESR